MPHAGVPQQWIDVVDALGLPAGGCSLRTLVECVATRRGRPIELAPVTGNPGRASGYLFVREDGDVIRYERAGGVLHQANTVAHELAHLLLEHRPHDAGELAAGASSDPTGGGLQLLDPTILELMGPRVLCRTQFDEADEADAETLAWLLLERASRRTAAVGSPLAVALRPRASVRIPDGRGTGS